MSMQSVFLIGAGQLGSRYLQGLSKLYVPCQLQLLILH